MKWKEKLKRLLVLGLAAGITINSIPLSSYAATIQGQESNMAVIVEEDAGMITEEAENETDSVQETTEAETESVVETEVESSIENETETETEVTTETETETEDATETEVETGIEAETETETEFETETESDTTTEFETETESETATEFETETEIESENEKEPLTRQIEELEKQAKEALKDIVTSEYVMALVYLCDAYEVKAEADFEAQTVETLTSGHTVLIQDVAVDTESMTIWYQVSFTADQGEKTGYILSNYLAYSNENFLTWEENYVKPIQRLLNENKGDMQAVFSDGAMGTYSSDVSQFPSSYQSALQKLKDSHPNWTFVKFNTGLNWNDVVYNQLHPKERSLVYYTRGEEWKNGKYDSSWYYASEAAVKYCLDPRNGLTDPRIFQFEQLTYNSSYHTVSAIQGILNSTFMKGTVPKATVSYAQAFYTIGKDRKLSPFHLASRVIQEQGVTGGSPLISGNYTGYDGQYKGYYNYFNVGATSDNPILNGLKYAKSKGWNTPYKSLEGGADTIGKNYILQGQDTLYLQKFDVESKYHGLYAHQYMQNIQAPTTEASTIRNLYNQAGALEGKFVFKIPVYNDMPDTASPEPGSETVSLNINSASVKGGYSTTVRYTINNIKSSSSTLSYCRAQDSIVSIKINNDETKTSGTTKTGTVTITGLKPGETYVTFTTSGGATAACKITVVKDTITLDKTVEVAAGTLDGSIKGTPIEINYEINNPKSEVVTCKVDKTDLLKAEVISEEEDSKNNKITGKIRLTGLKPGTAKLTLTSKYGGSATCTVKVVRLPEEIIMETEEIIVGIENSKTARVTVLPEDTTNKNLIWESSDESIAIVNPSTGRITGVGEGTATITVTTEAVTLKTGEQLQESCTVTVIPSVESVELAAEEVELSLKDGETFELNGKIILNGAETSEFYNIEYISADEEIATVDESGVVTPIAVGNTVITAIVKDDYASSGTKRATCKVSVIPEHKEEIIIPEYGYVQPESIQIYKNDTEEEITEDTYVNSPLKTDGKAVLKYAISPAGANVENVTWESSNSSIAEITQNVDVNGNYDGTVTITGKTKGNAVITVSTDIGIEKKLNIVVEGKQEITEVKLNKTDAVIYVNGADGGDSGVIGNESLSSTVQLNVTPAANQESGISYTWSSTNEAVAVVDENGKVTAVAPGKAVIVAEHTGGSGKYAKCTITVERCLEEITTSVDELYLQPNKKVTITASILPADSTIKNLEWESDNEEVATVTQKGVVTVKKNTEIGAQTVIRVTDRTTGLSKEIPLTVTAAATKSVTLYTEDTDEEGNPLKAGAQTLYVNGNEEEQSVIINAKGFDTQKAEIENLSFYATSSNKKVAEVVQNTDSEGVYDGTFKIIAKAKGSTNIKVFAADGSGKNATVKVTVKVYPEQVNVSKEALYITPGSSGTLGAVVTPSNANDKGVVWKFADGELKDSKHTMDGFTLDPKSGKVTIQRGTATGETAEFVAVSKSGGVESETTCTVTVISKKVTKVKLNKTSIIMTGDDVSQISEEQIIATVSPSAASVKDLKYTSNNEAVATVDEDGMVTATGYGMATITVSTLDNSKKATCKVYVTSLDKAYKLSAVTKNFNIQSYASDINSRCALAIKDQYGNILDNSLFTFTSNKPAVAEVDENGIVSPNKSFEGAKNGKATITATLTGDPYKRKVTFTVTVLAKNQAETVSVTAQNIRGTDITNKNFAVKYPITKDANTISLTAEALNVYGEALDTKLKWTVSDTSVAAIKVEKDTKSAVLTVKKAGKFYVTCTANDTLKKSRVIQITAVDTKPVLVNNKITLNIQSEPDEQSYVQATSLHFVENKECPIQNISVKSVKKGKNEINASAFEVKEVEDGYYAVFVPESSLVSLTKGNYNVVLSVETNGLPELGLGSKVKHDIPVTMSIVNTKPKVTVKTATINCQNLEQLDTVLQVTAPDVVESIQLVKGQTNKFDTRFELVEEDGVFILKFVDTAGYKASSITGKAQIKVAGYQPVTVNVKVNTPTTKASIVTSEVPALDVKMGRAQKITLIDKKTKEVLKNYTIEIPKDAKLDIEQNDDGTLSIKPVKEMVEKGKYKNGSNVTVKAKVMALSEEGIELWKDKVNVNISVKVYTATPTVSLGATTLQLNRQVPKETVETSISINRSNVRVADDSEWKIEQYNAKDKKYTMIKGWDKLPEETSGDIVLSYNRQSKTLCASFKEDVNVKAGNYKYRITWIAEDYSLVKRDVTVVVVDRKPTAKISSKGKLDLLTRSDSTMQGTIKLTNTKAKVKSITMMEPVASGVPTERNESFYTSWLGDNTFRIRLREGVKMTTGKKTIPVKIVLEGGTVLYSNVSFTVSQSTPKVVIPKAQTIYKSGSNTTVCYDMNTQIPKGYEISTIKTVSAPTGIGVTVENGRVSVSLANRYLKPGTCSIKVNMYFKGAQDVFGSDYGKALQKTLKVTVKE
ncbi:MAG: Ig-like domain-containing protein [Lachnospiraceae bacterium]|nr:Ig-like domain-containing protein [Lachnospiraceae bacterium]